MFDKPYRDACNGMHFPIDREEAYIREPARRDALAILTDAAERCGDQDMRSDEVRAAIDYLAEGGTYDWLYSRFWRGLGSPDPIGRRHCVTTTLEKIRTDQTHKAQWR